MVADRKKWLSRNARSPATPKVSSEAQLATFLLRGKITAETETTYDEVHWNRLGNFPELKRIIPTPPIETVEPPQNFKSKLENFLKEQGTSTVTPLPIQAEQISSVVTVSPEIDTSESFYSHIDESYYLNVGIVVRRLINVVAFLIAFLLILGFGYLIIVGIKPPHPPPPPSPQEIASTLQGYLDNKDYDAAEQYIDELKMSQEDILDNDPTVKTVYEELWVAIERVKERRTLFRTSLDKVRVTLKSKEPDMVALSQAESHAETDAEKFELKTIYEEIRNFQLDKQRQNDLALQQEIDAINVALARLTPHRGRETVDVLVQLDELLKKAHETRKLKGASTDVLNSRDLLIEQLEQLYPAYSLMKHRRSDSTGRVEAEPYGIIPFIRYSRTGRMG